MAWAMAKIDTRELFDDIPQDWEMTTLGDICERGGGSIQTGPFGSQLHASDYVAAGIPSIMPSDIVNSRISTKSIAMISEKDAERLSRHRVKAGNIVFSRRGDVTLRTLIRKEQEGWLCGTGSLKIDLGNEVVEPLFASLYFGHPDVKDWIVRHAVGSTMPNLNGKIMGSVPFLLPPLPEQHAIARILGALDDKIELNRRMNATLEAMAQALFKSWFVDFDPVMAKAEGRAPFGMSAETTALFPAEFVDSELGAIPLGWEVTTLGKVLDITKGRSYSSSELSDSDTALATLKSFKRGGGYRQDGLKPFTGKYKPEQVLKPGELVVACTDITQNADVVGRPAIIPHQNQFKTLVASLDLWILRPNEPDLSVPFLYNLLRTDDYVNYIIGYASGTTVLHLSKDGVPNYQFVKPSTPVLRAFEKFAKPIAERLISFESESRTLASIRDALLPRLLSGEVRVKSVERLGEIQ
jgi:type I restriction enzyme, S subunit